MQTSECVCVCVCVCVCMYFYCSNILLLDSYSLVLGQLVDHYWHNWSDIPAVFCFTRSKNKIKTHTRTHTQHSESLRQCVFKAGKGP